MVRSRYYDKLSDTERAKAIRREFEQARRQAREELQADRDFPQPKLPTDTKEKAAKFWGSKRGRNLIKEELEKRALRSTPGR